jgi:hypothetical protein
MPATRDGETVTGDFYGLFQPCGPYWIAVMGDVYGKGLKRPR